MTEQATVTQLLVDWRAGDGAARDRLVERILPQLRQIAAARLRLESNSSLSTEDLINEVILRVLSARHIDTASRAHFIALTSRMMRNVLTDHARAKLTDKRHHHKVELDTQVDGGQRLDLESLNLALIRLGALDEALMELVEMRYYGGMSIEEVALATGLSTATVKRRWATARAWLTDALAGTISNG